ncbi:MAG: hypothetical protein JSS86_10805 [Cyanobacteria bacterium SZAS LIN-2]|nr:hypothetical protein [Cyanobacteria bacterium SZAS LIN-2]MBS2006908.1 hypothetical protein [Cyanobacteria bacterium SZAS TMP-1]
MSCFESIKQAINALPDKGIFSTKSLCKYGSRNAVDQATHRLVKEQYIERVAAGQFIKAGQPWPSLYEIALAKAATFGKVLVTHGKQVAAYLRQNGKFPDSWPDPGAAIVFQVRGRTSSFLAGNRRITLKGGVDRKVHGGESSLAREIRALWHLGRTAGELHLHRVLSSLNSRVLEAIIEQAQWTPGWLHNAVREHFLSNHQHSAVTPK